MAEQTILTAAGLDKLKAELQELKETRRPAVVARIKEAVSYGDLSENSEYDDAKNEQGFIEGRIAELESMLGNAQIVKHAASDNVNVGSVVHVSNGADQKFTIVGPAEADPAAGLISNESPLGKALLGAKVGQTVNFETPKGLTKYTVKKIS